MQYILFIVIVLVFPTPSWSYDEGLFGDPIEISIDCNNTKRDIKVEFAGSKEQLLTGLMFRESLKKNDGMLFDFGASKEISMWMKNTFIPLDMIFISEDGLIENIKHNAEPFSEDLIPSGVPVRYVLEVNSGFAYECGLDKGERVYIPNLEDKFM